MKADIERIQKINLLDKDENIHKFYTEFIKAVAGNFFTNRRIAKYLIDERYKTKDITAFAFHADVRTIDTVYNAGLTYCLYMLVTKTNRSQFKVYVGGKREEVKAFFEDAIKLFNKKH